MGPDLVEVDHPAIALALLGATSACRLQLAIKPETLSRLTRALTDAGLIESDGRDFVIRDLERLIRHEM